MQTDGNLVIYLPTGEAIWSSDTYGHPNSSLVVQDDGNVVIYDPNHTALWATDTDGSTGGEGDSQFTFSSNLPWPQPGPIIEDPDHYHYPP